MRRSRIRCPARRRAWVSGVVAISALLLCCVGWVAALDKRQAEREAAAETELVRYLELVRAGRLAATYENLCSDVLWGDYAVGDHVAYLREQPVPETFEVVGSQPYSSRDGSYRIFRTRITDPDGRTETVSFTVGMELHGPRVCDAPGRRGSPEGSPSEREAGQ